MSNIVDNDREKKRTQIVSLLYIIFVCFSVLNIKISILDSNFYSIKSFEVLDKENRIKIDLSNTIINNNYDKINSTQSGHTYILIKNRLVELHVLILPFISFIIPSSYPSLFASILAKIQFSLLKVL